MVALILSLLCFQVEDPSVVSFVYHRFGDNRYPSTNIDIDAFEKQLQYLKQSKMAVTTLSEAMKWKNERAVVLTIDDAYLSFYQNGFPLLKKYGFTATLFINSNSVGGRDFMTWEQLREVMQYGIEIGNHTDDHAYFLNDPASTQAQHFKESIRQANKLIEKNLATRTTVFAYPFGEFNPAMAEIVQREGFQYAMAQNSGVIDQKSNELALPRFPMTGILASLSQFKSKVNMLALQGTMTDNPLFGSNPPTLDITITDKRISPASLQCFVNGQTSCDIQVLSQTPLRIRVTASDRLTSRRTLYTITAQSRAGNHWHWLSKLWVNPNVQE